MPARAITNLEWPAMATTTPKPSRRRPSARSTSAWRPSGGRTTSARAGRSSRRTSRAGTSRSAASSPIRPSSCMTAKVFDMLMAVPKYGKVKATQIPEHLPHLAGEDDRGPVGPAALRAAGAPSPVATRPRVIIVSGPSGAGKGTLIQGRPAALPRPPGRRVGDHPPHAARVRSTASTTTSSPRRSSSARVAAGEFLEHVTYAGNRYGTLRSEVDRILGRGALPGGRDRAGRRARGARG